MNEALLFWKKIKFFKYRTKFFISYEVAKGRTTVKKNRVTLQVYFVKLKFFKVLVKLQYSEVKIASVFPEEFPKKD